MRLTLTLIMVAIALPAQAQQYASGCTSNVGYVTPSDYGAFQEGASVDSLGQVQNSVSIDLAIANAPVGGYVCLPQGDYYLRPDTLNEETITSAINVRRDSVTVWGFGRNDDGLGTGLHTNGDTIQVDDDDDGTPDDVKRGPGLSLHANQSTGNEIDGVVLRDFELNGRTDGHTGEYGWPADPVTGDGWDISHKGIHLSDGGSTTAVSAEILRVWVHAYKGEQIYYGGNSLGTLVVDDIISEDTNASTINVAGDSVVVKNSEFGLSRFWVEIGPNQPNDYGYYGDNEFHDAAKRLAFVFSGGDGYATHEYIIENNTFTDCNFGVSLSDQLFQFSEGLAGSTIIRNNTMINCGGVLFTETGAASVEGTKNVTIEGNNITTKGGEVFYFLRDVDNILIKENDVTRTDAAVKNNTPSVAWAGSDKPNSRVIANVFRDTYRPTERSALVTNGKRPLQVDNKYVQGANSGIGYNVSAASPDVEPYNETTVILPQEATVEVVLATEHVPHGQKTTFTVNDRDFAGGVFQISDTNSTADFASTVQVGDGDSLSAIYDTTITAWRPMAKYKPNSFLAASGWDAGSVSADTLTGQGAFDGSTDDGGYFRAIGVDTTIVATDTLGIEASMDSVFTTGPSPFSSAFLRLAQGDSTDSDRVNLECNRIGYCRLTWRISGTLTKGNWQKISDRRYMRLRTDGAEVWAEEDSDLDGVWDGIPLDTDGYTEADDRISLALGSTPHAGVGVRSGQSGQDAKAIIKNIQLVSY